MKVIVHRGTQEIGGAVIEIQFKSSRILLEAGFPLFLNNKTIEREIAFCPPDKLLGLGVLPKIKGLYEWDTPTFDSILISHAHMDHYGLIDYIHPDIPVCLSKGTRKLIDLSALFLGTSRLQGKIFEFNIYEPFQIGDLRVMPFLMDHSAFYLSKVILN